MVIKILALFVLPAISALIVLRPIVGLALICLTAPFVLLQKIPLVPLEFDQILGALVFIGFLVAVGAGRIRSFRRTPLDIPIFFVMFFVLLALMFTSLKRPMVFQDFRSATSLISVLALYFLITNLVRNKNDFKFILYSLIAGGIAISAVSLYFYMMGIRCFSANIIIMKGRVFLDILRLQGFSGNSNSFATLYVFLVPLTFFVFICEKTLFKRIIFAVALILSFVCVFLSFSRSAWIGLFIGVLSLLFIANRKSARSIKPLILAGVIIVFALALLARFGYLSAILERMGTLLTGGESGGRGLTYKTYLEMILSNPLGVDVRSPESQVVGYGLRRIKPHNSILAIGAQAGWAGLLAILWFLSIQIKHLIRAIKLSHIGTERLYAMSFFVGTVAFWIHSSLHDFLQWSIVWIFFGLGMVYAAYIHGKPAGGEKGTDAQKDTNPMER